jgi:amino acid adenylation domain-containing protein
MTGALLHDPILDSVERSPDATAVVMGAERLTYAELDRLADRLAGCLLQCGCGPGERVCLLAPKSPATVAAMIATLRIGCAYVPVDVTGPVRRSARIVAAVQAAAAFVLGDGAVLAEDLAAEGVIASDLPLVDLSGGAAAGDVNAAIQRQSETKASDPAHILFTSGSTGRPKGIVVTHASARAYIDWAIAHFDIRPGDRCSGHPPLHFDLSTFDVYATLAAGGELHLLPPQILLPRQFADYIMDSELDQLFCVPSAMSYLSAFGAVPAEGFPSLRRILWCGEVLPTPVLIEWMGRHPSARFTNLYGPTETTIASSHYDVEVVPTDPCQPVPIGTACAGEELLVLDEDGSAAADGVVGELCIGGIGLSPGYWRDPETTAKAFVPDPRAGGAGGRIYRTGDLARRGPDGLFHFIGRRDSQIKHRGYRIELGEIEVAVAALSAVSECAVVAVPTDGFEGTVICCAAVLSAPDVGGTPAHLRAQLTSRLPGYMLPTRWRLMDVLPKNVNGKIDRREIRERFESELASR